MNNFDKPENNSQPAHITDASGQPDLTGTEQDRRRALGRIGRYSAYVAPAMLALLSSKAVAAS